MKFGSVENPGDHNFSLLEDHPETKKVLAAYGDSDTPNVFVGCAKWNKNDLKNFIPKAWVMSSNIMARISTRLN